MRLMHLLAAASLLVTSSWSLAANPVVEVRTNFGPIVIELFPDKAPKTVANFLSYVESGRYKGTVFHRYEKEFVLEGGGFTPDLKDRPRNPPVPNEANNGLRNTLGMVAMSRDPFDPNSATTDFFINLDNNRHLNFHKPEPNYMGYTVFGKVIRGMDTVEAIGRIPTISKGDFHALPSKSVVIEDVAMLTDNTSSPSLASAAPAKAVASSKKTKKPAVKVAAKSTTAAKPAAKSSPKTAAPSKVKSAPKS